AERFGSYSTVCTVAGILALFLAKSISLYFCLCPPPILRMVIFPVLLRPPVFFFGRSRLFSGVDLVISSRVFTIANLVPGVTGFNLLIAIFLDIAIEIYTAALLKGDYRLFISRFAAMQHILFGHPGFGLACIHHGAYFIHFYFVNLFNFSLYLFFVGMFVNNKSKLV